MPDARILIVDDEEDTLQAIGFCLSQEGFTVLEARDGLEAMKVAEAERPDVVVLDVMLPGLNGYEVSRRLKEGPLAAGESGLRILLLTARRVDSLEREEFLAAWSQADLVMYKPFEMDELLRQVTRLAAVTRRRDAARTPATRAN
jgi:DNA-binding response OmpR family regulator